MTRILVTSDIVGRETRRSSRSRCCRIIGRDVAGRTTSTHLSRVSVTCRITDGRRSRRSQRRHVVGASTGVSVGQASDGESLSSASSPTQVGCHDRERVFVARRSDEGTGSETAAVAFDHGGVAQCAAGVERSSENSQTARSSTCLTQATGASGDATSTIGDLVARGSRIRLVATVAFSSIFSSSVGVSNRFTVRDAQVVGHRVGVETGQVHGSTRSTVPETTDKSGRIC